MTMTCDEIKQILAEYNIDSIEELRYSLEVFNQSDECIDDPEYEKKNCLNSKCYEEYFVPDCRKIVEIYKKYFQHNIKNKKLFIQYLAENIDKNISSIENYMSCKSCNQQIEKNILTSIKISDSDFKKDFCSNLSIKFSFRTLFETDYTSIGQFLKIDHQITRDNFIPSFSKVNEIMTSLEEEKLFDAIHTSKEEFKKYLNDNSDIEGSPSFLFNLALSAFDRNLVDECNSLLLKIAKLHPNFSNAEEYLQLKSKILSTQGHNKEAIKILEQLIDSKNSVINSETYNLLAASIKRDAFYEYEKYSDDHILKENLTRSRDIYYSIYKLKNDYYPALNYIYLQMMIAYLDGREKEYFQNLQQEAKRIWNNLNHKTTDWWSFIAQIEFLILIEDFEKASDELRAHFEDLQDLEISDFNILSTVRQLELYNQFCNNKKLIDIINYIKELSN